MTAGAAQFPPDGKVFSVTGRGKSMQRFIAQRAIYQYRELLSTETEPRARRILADLLTQAQRDFALSEAALGLENHGRPIIGSRGRGPAKTSYLSSEFRWQFENAQGLRLLLHPGPGLHIVDLNDGYARATMTERTRIAGERVFNIFPDNPDDPGADGVAKVYESFRIVAETGRPHAMAVQRYDVRDPAGHFVERYWRPVNRPVFDRNGNLVYLLHEVEDVTDAIQASSGSSRK